MRGKEGGEVEEEVKELKSDMAEIKTLLTKLLEKEG